jgi:hypothetical protein
MIKLKWVLACNPSYSRGEIRKILVRSQPQANSSWDPISEKTHREKGLRSGSSRREAQSSNPSAGLKKKKKMALSNLTSILQIRNWHTEASGIQRKDVRRHSEKTTICNQGERPQKKQTLLRLKLGLLPSRTMRNKFLLFKPPSLWYPVMAGLANQQCFHDKQTYLTHYFAWCLWTRKTEGAI